MQISYATAGFKDQLQEALDGIAAAGYSHIELSSQEGHLDRVFTNRELEQLRSRIGESGLRAGTVHAPMMRNVLGAPEEDWRREKAALLGEYLRMSGALGAGGMVIHPVPNPRFVEDPERPELTGIMSAAARRSLDELAPVALESGVRILLENLPYRSHYPFLTMTELRGLVDDYPEEAVGLVVDTGHAWTSGNDPAGGNQKRGRAPVGHPSAGRRRRGPAGQPLGPAAGGPRLGGDPRGPARGRLPRFLDLRGGHPPAGGVAGRACPDHIRGGTGAGAAPIGTAAVPESGADKGRAAPVACGTARRIIRGQQIIPTTWANPPSA